MRRDVALSALLAWLACCGVALAAGPRVGIVVGERAPSLERRAADEIAALVTRLYQADAHVQTFLPDKPANLIVVGSPMTNPTLAELGDKWPKLTSQGHLLRSVQIKGQNALLVGGGSPEATYWASAELAHRWGVRSLLYGDVQPVSPPPFQLDGFSTVLEPAVPRRAWRVLGDSLIGTQSWSLADHEKLIAQLAKLKFNRLILEVHPWQPWVDFEFEGQKKTTGVLLHGQSFPVSGDTAGRKAFDGAKFFENPDFASLATYEDRSRDGQTLMRGIIDAAHKHGMRVAISIDPLAFSKEFSSVLKKSEPLARAPELAVAPAPTIPSTDEPLLRLAKRQLRAYLETYPKLDEVYLSPQQYVASETILALVNDNSLWHPTDGQSIAVHIGALTPNSLEEIESRLPPAMQALAIPGETARRAALNRAVLVSHKGLRPKTDVLLPFSDRPLGPLPEVSYTSIHDLMSGLVRPKQFGFAVDVAGVGDADFTTYLTSRGSFSKLTIEQAAESFVTPICGEGVAPSVLKALGSIASAATLVDQNDLTFATVAPDMILKHYQSTDPLPEWWGKTRQSYLDAMNEFYRANTRAREGGRSYTLYLARRCEFGFEYMNVVTAVRNAAIAREKNDAETQIAELEKAVESMHGGLNALAAVARSPSDRAVIAVLNEYGYRPLVKTLEEADAAP